MDKFLLAEKSITGDSTFAIVHLPEPAAIILVREGHVFMKNKTLAHYIYIDNNDVHKPFTFILWHVAVTRRMPSTPVNRCALLRMAWDWYTLYMKSKEGVIDLDK